MDYVPECIFANTGQEREETLEFIRDIASLHNLNVTWIENVTHLTSKKSSTHRIVDFESADRRGKGFTEMVSKYGIPNMAYPHCTRELKANPIKSYLIEKYGSGNYRIQIGIRADEAKRHPKDLDNTGPFTYPLIYKTTKTDINAWFEKQPFRLNLHEHQGNCKTCWKKSDIKLAAVYQENPEFFEYFDYLERNHSLDGHNVDGTHRVCFRKNRSTVDMIEAFKDMEPFTDAYRKARESGSVASSLCGEDFGGCGESCEPFSEGWDLFSSVNETTKKDESATRPKKMQ